MARLLVSILLYLSLMNIFFFRDSLGRQQESPFLYACQFNNLNATEPVNRIRFEAGQVEYWDHTEPNLRCAGVAVARFTIQPNGLFLPTFFSSPGLSYVIQGKGYMGMIMSGCAETFQESEGNLRGRGEEERSQSRRIWDMHQKIQKVSRGEVHAELPGMPKWWFNDGNASLVVVTLLDITNRENQLDNNPRVFQVAGSYNQSEEQQDPQERLWSSENVFKGIDPEILAQVFGIHLEQAKKLHNENDRRGNIIHVKEKLRLISPSRDEIDWRKRQPDNGFQETFCTMRLHENIDLPSHAQFYSSRAGRLNILNSFTLPILRRIRLSAVRGLLNGGGLVLPHWTQNAHSVMYVTGGRAKCEVVDDSGRSVFAGEVRRGQVLVIPQGFVVVKRAGREGFEWISFRTNENGRVNTLAGKTSFMRAIPVDVIAVAFQMSREEASNIKFGRQEDALASTPL